MGGKTRTSFKAGDRANPKGRPAGYNAFRESCREMTPAVLELLASEVRDRTDKRDFASKLLLEYAWGRPSAAPEDADAAQALVVKILKLSGDDE
jgi:hypothetical protein